MGTGPRFNILNICHDTQGGKHLFRLLREITNCVIRLKENYLSSEMYDTEPFIDLQIIKDHKGYFFIHNSLSTLGIHGNCMDMSLFIVLLCTEQCSKF